MYIKFINRSVSSSAKFGPFFRNVYGLGRATILRLCRQLGINYSTKFESVSYSKRKLIEVIFARKPLGLDLSRTVQNRISDKIRLGGFAGLRLSQNLPSRGQRTKTNARTSKKGSKKKAKTFVATIKGKKN
jgi:small subunit ribosomal protein S13